MLRLPQHQRVLQVILQQQLAHHHHRLMEEAHQRVVSEPAPLTTTLLRQRSMDTRVMNERPAGELERTRNTPCTDRRDHRHHRHQGITVERNTPKVGRRNNNNNTTPMRPILLRTITSLRHHIIMPLRRLLLTMPIHRLNMEHHRHILTGNMLCHRHPEIDRAMLSKRIHLRTPEDCWKWTSEPRRKYRRSGIGNRRNTNCPYPASSPSNRIINGLRKTQ
mmetsp:Transcript_6604/g.18515  ORF Transcript_6604/g.18515 Transcript_6604/m.18515 type:complete len:220 (-) Transcript_6604:503-1162(-)